MLDRSGSNEEWKKIAEQITKETDSAKLTMLVKQLCEAFDGSCAKQKKPIDGRD